MPRIKRTAEQTGTDVSASVSVKKQQPTVDDVVTDIVKQKRKRPDRTEALTPNCEPGEISKMLGQAVTISHWPPFDTNDPQQMSQRIDLYHQYCIENDIKPDMVGMALAIGVDRSTLWRWENGVESNKPQSVRNVIKKGREINELMLSQMMQNGRINPVVGIFLLKNSHGYKDQQDVVITPNNPLDTVDSEQARQKYVQALPEADDGNG